MQRWLAAMITALVLSAMYQLYCGILLPQLVVQGTLHTAPPEKLSSFPAFAAVAQAEFPDFSWTANAAIKWQLVDREAYLFAETIEPIPNNELLTGDQRSGGSSLKCTPLAILWRDPLRPQAKPYRIIADSARIQFEHNFFSEAFDFSQLEIGHIVAGALDGKVTIDGPDGLLIRGRDFVFSETNAELSSYHAVTFAYGPTAADETRIQGAAEGLNLRFIPASSPVLGRELPRIAGPAAIALRQNVRLRFELGAGDSGNTGKRAAITSRGPAEYDFATRKALFEEDVRVTQQLHDPVRGELTDRMVCESLGLQFEPDPATFPAGNSEEDDSAIPALRGLRLRLVHAVGRPASRGSAGKKLILESQQQEILANLNDLRYDAVDHIAEFRDQQQVVVQRGATKFSSPFARLVHTADNQLVGLECAGPGTLEHLDDRFADGPLSAAWQDRVTVAPAGESFLVKLLGQPRFDVPGQLVVSAEQTSLWFAASRLPGGAAERQPTESRNNFLLQPLPLERAEARGNVFIISPDLIVGRTGARGVGGAQRVSVEVFPGQLSTTAASGFASATAGSEKSPQRRNPAYVEADQLQVQLTHDVVQGRLEVRQVAGEGRIRLEQSSSETMRIGGLEAERRLTISAVSFLAHQSEEGRQVVTLIGKADRNGDVSEPAKVELGPFVIEGGLLTLDREGNLASVEGPGRITFPVPMGLSGEPLEQPAEMMVVWKERMLFDGLQATFHGAVQASLENDAENKSRLECEELVVTLLQRVNFQSAADRQQPAELKSIAGKHQVRLDAYSFSGTKIIARRHAELASFQVDRPTGDFSGQGPGQLEFWTFGNSVRLTRAAAPVANRPATADSPTWRYTKVIFRGKLTGNIEREHAELTDDVEIVSAPVEKHTHTFSRHGLSRAGEQAANAVWIGCDKLQLNYPLDRQSGKRQADLLAVGNTELEAQQFHATAGEIKFEELQGRFTLRGHGRDALLHFQRSPGVPADTTSNRLIEFTPSIPRISVDGSSGISGGL